MYYTPQFCKRVLQYKAEKEDPNSIPYQLQKLFTDLTISDEPAVSIQGLTSAFGWVGQDYFVQHDATEFQRLLFEALSRKEFMDCSDFFQGTLQTRIQCLECGHISK